MILQKNKLVNMFDNDELNILSILFSEINKLENVN